MEKERVKQGEPTQVVDDPDYEALLTATAAERHRAKTGQIVIRAKEIPWRQNRQALVKTYLNPYSAINSAAADWLCFVHDVKVHSGRHRHQGGIHLFVLEGDGYTVVDNQKLDWEKWDLITLPVKPRGCEHQHYNKKPGHPAKWMAFQYNPFNKPLGNMFEQVEDSPDWKGKNLGGAKP